jgi:uncharacterized membrane protein YhaH (DUF805 family)
MNHFLSAFKKYAVFSGRAQRAEYWYFFIFYFVVLLVILAFEPMGSGKISGPFSLLMLLPALAVSARRMHDIGKSGWMILINLIPLIGQIWFFVLAITNSNPGTNKFGPNPKAAQPITPPTV